VTKPVFACDGAGYKLTDPLAISVCDAGGIVANAATCADNKPWAVNPSLSYGFASVTASDVQGLVGDANCGQCYELKFVEGTHVNTTTGTRYGGTHPDLVNKSMVVQVTNVGHGVTAAHSFDIHIPGAGQRTAQRGCSQQFNDVNVDDFDCGQRVGGCDSKASCARLPNTLRSGCEWRFDWLQYLAFAGQTNNPYVQFRRVRCPEALTNKSGSVPLDDAPWPIIDPIAYR